MKKQQVGHDAQELVSGGSYKIVRDVTDLPEYTPYKMCQTSYEMPAEDAAAQAVITKE